MRLTLPALQVSPNEIVCRIQYIDRFGNLVTNLDLKTFGEWMTANGGAENRVSVSWNEERIEGLSRAYGEKEPGELLAVFDGYDRLEIAVREGSAARHTRLGIGAQVTVYVSKE